MSELSPRPPAGELRFEVTPQGGEQLQVEASFAARGETGLVADRDAAQFYRDFETWSDGKWIPVPKHRGARRVQCRGTCRFRYEFDLGAAADQLGETAVAERSGAVIVAPPSTWLAHPRAVDGAFSFRVETAADVGFATGAPVMSDGAYWGHSDYAWQSAYAAFGPMDRITRDVAGSELEIAVAKSDVRGDRELVVGWVERAAEATVAYFGRFPVERALVLVLPVAGDRIFGKQMGLGGASVVLWVGDGVTEREFEEDWIATHELTHLAFPSMKNKHLWMNEGLATYVEPFARARARQIDAEAAWAAHLRRMHHALPGPGDEGFERTPSWASTYWGGALYWLLCDLELRQRTRGEVGVDDVMAAVLEQGGNTSVVWRLEALLAAARRRSGTSVLEELYRKMALAPYEVDLDALWQKLGIVVAGDSIRFDDSAPLAQVRREITGVASP